MKGFEGCLQESLTCNGRDDVEGTADWLQDHVIKYSDESFDELAEEWSKICGSRILYATA